MKQRSATQARAPLVVLVVLALLFMGISALAYPTLSSENGRDNPSDSVGRANLASDGGDDDPEGSDGEGYIVKGVVVNERGQPIAGAHVQLFRIVAEGRPNDEPMLRAGKSVTTDGEGNFGFRGVEQGGYTLLTEARGYQPDRQQIRVHEDTRLKVVLKLAGSEPEPPVESSSLRGVVMNEKGDPIPGALVQLFRLRNNGRGDRDTDLRPVMTATTDREGNFGFRNLEQGGYSLLAEARGYRPDRQQVKIHGDTWIRVILKPAMEPESPHFTIHATPVDGDGDGHPDDVMITAFDGTGRPLGGVMIHIDGIYVGATSYQGWLLDLDHRPGPHEVVGMFRDQRAETRFVVPGGRPHPGDPDPGEPGMGLLEGLVYSANDPVPGALVEIISEDLHFRTITGRGGAFLFEGIPAGRYVITVSMDGYHPYRDRIGIATGGNRIRVALEPVGEEPDPPVDTSSVEGVVVNPDGDIIQGGSGYVTAHHDALDIVLVTRIVRDGTFHFPKVPAGLITLTITMEGYHQVTVTLRAPPGETAEITVPLRPVRG